MSNYSLIINNKKIPLNNIYLKKNCYCKQVKKDLRFFWIVLREMLGDDQK